MQTSHNDTVSIPIVGMLLVLAYICLFYIGSMYTTNKQKELDENCVLIEYTEGGCNTYKKYKCGLSEKETH